MRPPKPEGVPTPLKIIEDSRGWKAFFVLFAMFAVLAAIVSVSVGDFGSWLSERPWLLFPAVLTPIAGPIVQNQIAVYRACGEN